MQYPLFFLFLLCQFTLWAQYPATDIYLLDFSEQNETFVLSNPIKIYDNKGGYDNQPSFTPDGKKILFTSGKVGENQTDIFSYNLQNKAIVRLTKTPESEFSPIVMPDKKHFSTVRIETDKDSTQRMWYFPLALVANLPHTVGRLVMDKVKKVGYYRWLDAQNLALFILGEKDIHSLQIVHRKSQQVEKIAENIGRTITLIPKEKAISFIQKKDTAHFLLQKYDIASKNTTTILATLPQVEDFAWHPKGFLLAGKDGILYRFDPKKDKTWQAIADVKSLGLKSFGRIVVSPKGDKIAIVCKE